MAFTIVDATGPIISAKITGELSNSEVHSDANSGP
jgi:hypothetical protein